MYVLRVLARWDETSRNGANDVWDFLSFLLCDKNGQIAFDFPPLSPHSPTSHLQLDITNRGTLLSRNREQYFVLHVFQWTIWTQAYTVHELSDFISIFNRTVQTPGVCLLFQCAWYSLSTLSEVTCSHFHQRHQRCSKYNIVCMKQSQFTLFYWQWRLVWL